VCFTRTNFYKLGASARRPGALSLSRPQHLGGDLPRTRARQDGRSCFPSLLGSMGLGMSGKRRERIASRMEQAPRRSALGDGLACETPMSPVPIPLALGRAASGRAAVHSATALSSDLARAAWRAGSGSGAAFASHGVVSHFSLPPGWFTAPTMAWPPSFTFTC
jgi:hypothetical protein